MSALEVGIFYPGTTGMRHHSDGSSYEGWSYGKPNAAGGIGVKHEIYNASEKSMKYITFVYIPYNRVGDAVACTTKGEIEARGRVTGPFGPDERTTVQWEILWYNPTITEVKLKEVIIQYMDDTQETISGEDIKNIYSTDSAYYEKRGKQEQAERAEKAKEREQKKKQEEAAAAEKAKKSALKRSYLCFMVLTRLKKAKEDEETKFHANQGLLLFVAEILAVVIGCIPVVGGAISFILWAIAIAFSVRGIIDINKNMRHEIPFIGKIKLLK